MRLIYISLIAVVMTGCAMRSAEKTIPRTGATIAETYRNSTGAGGVRHERRTDVELAGYTRERVSETQQLFPTIANPVIVMYVYPHMVGDMPIPGYSTGIRMYDKDQFAMPGEK